MMPRAPRWLARDVVCGACGSEIAVGQGDGVHDYHWVCVNASCENNDPGAMLMDDEGSPEWAERPTRK